MQASYLELVFEGSGIRVGGDGVYFEEIDAVLVCDKIKAGITAAIESVINIASNSLGFGM